MIVLHGMYSFGRRVVAFRNDFCLSCGVARLAYLHPTFEVIHIILLPLSPRGFWRRWHCGTCGRNPRAAGRTRLPFKIAAAVTLGVLTLALFLEPAGPRDAGVMWFLRCFFGIPFILTCIWMLRSKPDQRVDDLLRTTRPSEATSCPICGVVLVPGQRAWSCPRCGMEGLGVGVGG